LAAGFPYDPCSGGEQFAKRRADIHDRTRCYITTGPQPNTDTNLNPNANIDANAHRDANAITDP
jgi:hypothetical protein